MAYLRATDSSQNGKAKGKPEVVGAKKSNSAQDFVPHHHTAEYHGYPCWGSKMKYSPNPKRPQVPNSQWCYMYGAKANSHYPMAWCLENPHAPISVFSKG